MANHCTYTCKNTPCPDCGKYGLIRYYAKSFMNNDEAHLKIRCKECNSFWNGDEAQKLSELIDTNHVIRKRK